MERTPWGEGLIALAVVSCPGAPKRKKKVTWSKGRRHFLLAVEDGSAASEETRRDALSCSCLLWTLSWFQPVGGLTTRRHGNRVFSEQGLIITRLLPPDLFQVGFLAVSKATLGHQVALDRPGR